MFFAFVTGAGVATTAIILSQKARKDAAASAEQLLAKCSQAVEALDSQAQTVSA